MTDLAQRLSAEVAAIIDPGIDLEDLTVSKAGRRQLVRVVIDRDGGIDLDLVAAVSHQVSEVLDRPDFEPLLGDSYVLEVTSPGTDRPLTTPAHWRRALSRLVIAELADGTSLTARIESVSESGVVLNPVEGDPVDLPFDQLVRGTVQVEFNRSDKE